MEAEGHLTGFARNGAAALDSAEAGLTRPSVSVEALAYIGLFLIALLLRVSDLDKVPISDFEAAGALQAWHTIEDDAPGAYTASSSPLTYVSQVASFSLLGASEFTARIGTALAGLALAITPLLFRESLGRTRTFIWALLLSVLTAPMVSSRSADGGAFMMLFTVLAIWSIRRYWYSRRLSDACWAIAFITFMVWLSSPAGIPLLLILLAAGWLAVWRTALSAPQRLELPGDDILQLAVKRLREFPFAGAVFAPLLLVVLASTLFMSNPAGLRTVSQLIAEALRGLTFSKAADGAQLGFVALLTYEPLLIIYALGGAWLLWKKGDVTYLDRFAAAWAALGALGLLLYPGAKATDAMWVALPLTMLASYGITQLMVDRRVVILWGQSDDEGEASALYTTRYRWVKWAISALVFMFLVILSTQFMQVARLMLELPAGMNFIEFFPALREPAHTRLLHGLGLLALTAIIALIVFLLTANFWGMGTCLQGIGLGFFWLALLSGAGGAWRGAVVGEFDLWAQRALSEDAYLLRETLFELANRDSAGMPALEIKIVPDKNGIIRADGAVAWLLRDFSGARFVNTVEEAAGAQLLLTAYSEGAADPLAGDYVGQRFRLRRSWSLAQLGIWDWPAWWSQGRLRSGILGEEAVLLWLRQDVYDGVSAPRRPHF
ncbi:MAG: hypothetical protein OXN88_09275 [Chloroflexota bacterium]|nr:hypothetical protein [Chloroflexota bacterium]